ncbi:ECF transporter S component [Sporohalobacter salinus]|uniref:ECF transporter S component n=1 Tax=Sporohalobacter salinus TaxID=1494606 RepID=UPI001961759E|nr:ECF transporter S component [Sporohalobacter salinus]MBM7624098.1 putative membrane protein [Sporohalobacter salinus]
MNKTKELSLNGISIALIAVATMVIKVPVPATEGYIHLGDSMIYIVSILFGWKTGLIAGGLGSALADLFSGYAHWAFPTLIIKGLEGLIIGKIAYKTTQNTSLRIKDIIAALTGGGWMVLGYYLAGVILTHSFAVPLSSIPWNIIQAVGGAIIAFPIIFAIIKSNILKFLHN